MGWNRIGSRGRSLLRSALLAIGLTAGISGVSRAQVIEAVSNGNITALVGVSGNAGTNPDVRLAGRMGVLDNLFLVGGAPGDLMTFITTATKQSYITIRIDGGAPTPGADADTQTSPGWDLIWGDEGSNALDGSATAAKDDQGAWIQVPTVTGNVLTARWTTLPGGNDDFPIPLIEVHLKLTLIYDMACYQFTIINKDSSAHTVGLRFAQELAKPAAGLPDGPIYTPNLGMITSAVDLIGSSVPPFWRGHYPGDSSTGAFLISNNPTTLVTRPDRVTFGSPLDVTGSIWNFTLDPTYSLVAAGGDASSGVYFNETRLIPGESRVITTYYGRNRATIDFDSPFPAGIDAPFSVKYDSTKPVGQQFTPNPLSIAAFVQNPRTFGLTNVQATISLPAGLELAAGETPTKTVGDLAPNAEGKVTWQVVPNGMSTGIQTIAVSFTAAPGTQGKVVTRTIELPALPSKAFVTGIQMVSFPFNFDDPTPTVALGLSQIDFDLLRWNTQLRSYEPVSRILPGEGYWLRLFTGRTIDLQGAKPVQVGTTPYELELRAGWQQIGNPFLYRVRWSDVQVINTDVSDPNALQPVSILEAAQRGWIQATIFRYDPTLPVPDYVYDVDLSTDLIPFEGYWIRAFRTNISLLIPPTSGRAAKVAQKSRAVSVPGGWSLRLSAHGERSADTFNFIGLGKGAEDGVDRFDVEKPPAPQGGVSLGIQRPNWGRRSGVYTADFQSMGGRKQWEVLVTSSSANENVTLSWPDIARLPKGYELYIVDKSTGERKMMRQSLAWRVNTGASASRAFTVSAEPRGPNSGALMLNATAKPGRAGSGAVAQVNVTANTDATVTVRILGSNGQSVRQIVGGRAASAGKDLSFVWDGKDQRGVSVPSGFYTIEVKGVTPDGQTSKTPVPFTIVR